MRIVLGPGIREFNYRQTNGNARLSPHTANHPTIGGIYTVERRGQGSDGWGERDRTQLTFRYADGERFVMGESGEEWRQSKLRASCVVYPDDKFVLPLVPGVTTPDVLRRFLHRRTERHHYECMFPTLKAAIAALEREAAAEAPFRRLLASVLAKHCGVADEEAADAVDDLVMWWKTKTKSHRPLLSAADLPTDASDVDAVEEAERSGRALRAMLSEFEGRARDARRPVDEDVVAQLCKAHPTDRLVIARPRRGGYLVVVAAEPDVQVYVHEYEYTAKGELKDTREWIIPRPDGARAWRVIEESDRWRSWNFRAHESQYLRGPERAALRDQAIRKFEETGNAVVLGQHRENGRVRIWTLDEEARVDASHVLTRPPRGPKIGVLEGRWHRVGGGVEWEWLMYDSHVAADESELPWDAVEWRSMAERDNAEPRPMVYEVVHRDDDLYRAVEGQVRSCHVTSERHDLLAKRARELTQSVEEEWLRARWAEARARFDEDFGDPSRWPAQREMIARKLHFPNKWDLWGHAGSRLSAIALRRAIAHFVEVGEDPGGRTVGALVDEATERWGAQWASEDRSFKGKRKSVDVPDALLDFVVSGYVFAHEPDSPGEPDGDEDGGPDHDRVSQVVDDILAAVVADEGRDGAAAEADSRDAQ